MWRRKGWPRSRAFSGELQQHLDGVELGFVGAGGEIGGVLGPVGVGGVEVGYGGVDGGVELGVDEEGKAGARDVWDGADEILLVDGGEAVAAGVDEEALEAGDAGAGEGFEVALVVVDAAAPEGVVDHALRGGVGAAGGGGFALELEGGYVGGLGEAVEGHVDERGEAAGRCGAGGGGETFPVGAAGLVDVGVGVDEAGEEGEIAEVFCGMRVGGCGGGVWSGLR